MSTNLTDDITPNASLNSFDPRLLVMFAKASYGDSCNNEIITGNTKTERMQSVHAPLVELGTVDKKYTTAMEVACGNKMTHIVVDNEEAAAAAIELLLSSKAGRATFIPLNKIAKAPSNLNLPKDNRVIDFAINLVNFDNKYINAFYYAVGETIVVENMECTQKLIGKYRMVTLRGELFEKSGLITGGLHIRLGLSFKQNKDFAAGTMLFDVFQGC